MTTECKTEGAATSTQDCTDTVDFEANVNCRSTPVRHLDATNLREDKSQANHTTVKIDTTIDPKTSPNGKISVNTSNKPGEESGNSSRVFTNDDRSGSAISVEASDVAVGDDDATTDEPSPTTTVVNVADIAGVEDLNTADNGDGDGDGDGPVTVESIISPEQRVTGDITDLEMESLREEGMQTESPGAPASPCNPVNVERAHKRARYMANESQENDADLPKEKQSITARRGTLSKATVDLLRDEIESISGCSEENSSSDEDADDYDDDDDDNDDDDADDDDVAMSEHDNDSSSGETVTATETTDIECGLLKKIDITDNPDKIYYVRGDDGSVHSGQILKSRCSENSSTPDEYYVHYVGFNRRLDSWVGRHRISDKPDDLSGLTVITPTKHSREKLLPTTNTMSAIKTDALHSKRAVIKDNSHLASENTNDDYGDRKMTRLQKRRYDEINHVHKSHAMQTAAQVELEKEHESLTRIKYIDRLMFGNFEIDTWYFSPFPDEYREVQVLYVCEYCLKYMRLEKSYKYHRQECQRRKPPGREIYRKGIHAIFEVIGKEQPLYCQLLCLMAKLFLDHKALYYDMDPFLFYVLCEIDREGYHIVGYFSKEQGSADNNNVACILVLPPYQRKGYGKLLIDLSYELSRKEGIIGSPERPLSDLGRLSYRSYWAYTLLEIMKGRNSTEHVSIKELSEMSGITQDDIIYTLQSMKMIKYWRGQHVICVTPKVIYDHLQMTQFQQPKLMIDLDYLHWKPPEVPSHAT